LGACSNIIGVSSYDIDPSLDGGSGGKSSTSGGKSSTGGNSTVEGGSPETGGKSSGGKASGGTGGTQNTGGTLNEAGTGPVGGEGGEAPVAGAGGAAAGAGGEGGAPPIITPPTGCKSSKDCDDLIDCTKDTCQGDGKCAHAPDDTVCDARNCETCTVGIGCVGGAKKQTQILLDPNFDTMSLDWDDSGSDITNIVPSASAQSGGYIAKFGPQLLNSQKYEYDDLLQSLTLPKGVVGLTLTGYYKLTHWSKTVPAGQDDYVVTAMYALGDINPTIQFHSFPGNSGDKTAWTAFTYDASAADMAKIVNGGDFTFDLVGHVFAAFQFDTLTLTQTVCQ
jgi:hypothetical protein